MNRPEIIDIVDDRLERRFEAYAQSQIKLHEEYHNKLLQAVTDQIKTTVNGKIDSIKGQLDKQDIILKDLDNRIKPFEDGVSWFTKAKNGAGWVAGFVTSLTLIGGALLLIFNKLTK